MIETEMIGPGIRTLRKIKGLIVTLYPTNSQTFARISMPHTTDELAFVIEGEMILAIVDKERNIQQNILRTDDSYLYAGQNMR